jgi:hypothetical protein
MAHIPRERLCFDKHAELNFHLAMRPSGEFSMEASRWMVDQYPEDIREWIKTMGGVERMPLPSPNHPAGTFYMLFPVQLWAIGSAPIDRATSALTPSPASQRHSDTRAPRVTGRSEKGR